MWTAEEIVTEFIFLGNESARNENMLYNTPFRNKVGCIYVNFYKMQKKITSLLRKNMSLLSWLCFETFQQIWIK